MDDNEIFNNVKKIAQLYGEDFASKVFVKYLYKAGKINRIISLSSLDNLLNMSKEFKDVFKIIEVEKNLEVFEETFDEFITNHKNYKSNKINKISSKELDLLINNIFYLKNNLGNEKNVESLVHYCHKYVSIVCTSLKYIMTEQLYNSIITDIIDAKDFLSSNVKSYGDNKVFKGNYDYVI